MLRWSSRGARASEALLREASCQAGPVPVANGLRKQQTSTHPALSTAGPRCSQSLTRRSKPSTQPALNAAASPQHSQPSAQHALHAASPQSSVSSPGLLAGGQVDDAHLARHLPRCGAVGVDVRRFQDGAVGACRGEKGTGDIYICMEMGLGCAWGDFSYGSRPG